MRATQHVPSNFSSVLKDVQRCITNLSQEVLRLSEEHEREIAGLGKVVEGPLVEPPKASRATAFLTSNSHIPCDSLEAEEDTPKRLEEPVSGTKTKSAFADQAVEATDRSSATSLNSDQAARSHKSIIKKNAPADLAMQAVSDDAVGGATTSHVDQASSAQSAIKFNRDSEISASGSLANDNSFQHAGSDDSVRAVVQFSHEDEDRKSRVISDIKFNRDSESTSGSRAIDDEFRHAGSDAVRSTVRSTVQFSHENEEVAVHPDGDDSASVHSRKSVTFKRWSTRTSLTTSGGDYEEEAIIRVLPIWTNEEDMNSLVRVRASHKERPSEESTKRPTAPFFLDRFVSSPDSMQRLLWDILGMVIIGYDLIVIPLQAFNLKPSSVTDSLSWFTTCYWTLDIPTSFLVGYHTKGVVEMRTRKIAPRYLKGWFAFDVSVVSVDWVMSTVQTSENTEVKSSLRFLRMVRLLRLLKVIGFLNELLKRIQSEWLLIILGIVNLLVFIMLTNHMIACAWFWVGQRSDSVFGDSWITKNAVTDADVGYQYTTALHWSLTQFTPASMEVVPRNTYERAYNVITLLFAMVTFSSFVSSITNAMTRLRHLNSQWMEEQSLLRQYLQENQISANLTSQIYSFLQKSNKGKGRKIHTQDVVMLERLSKTLQDSLRSEVYTPILTAHPFFLCFHQVYPDAIQRIYRFAMEESTIACDQELFRLGELADCVHFVVKGEFKYTLCGTEMDEAVYTTIVDVGAWLCEQALWIDWRHCGQLVASRHSEVVDVQALKFQNIVRRELVGVIEPCKYAQLFAEYADDLARSKKLTDIIQDYETIEEIANEAWAAAMSKQNSLEMLRKNQFKAMGHSMMKSARHALSHLRRQIDIR